MDTASSSSVQLLPPLALLGRRIGVSVSDSTDLARLGLTDTHFRLALREIARTALVGGGTLAYGGHLRPDGFTVFLVHELASYARTGTFNRRPRGADAPLLVCLSQQEHRACSIETLKQIDADLGVYGELRCLDLQGNEIDWRAGRSAEAAPYPTDPQTRATDLSALRRFLTSHTSGRVLLGGKRHGYQGSMPGVLEEALFAVQANQPLYLSAGFGGATLNIAAAVDARLDGFCPIYASDPALDDATSLGLARMRELTASGGWDRLQNGLDHEENMRLATTHRPAEISALVALGLGRLAGHS